ncbi:Pumilio-family RNA binding repeat containing protein [Tritrichomonas foetus]|uniref:Pumilio-family RNA binding repeat containing protein n=1 Tax=Tritrichomonas foetus TaxID=1144522 RepID=A0A1J4J481_9EUKA|nr:Pumilio-family RNA binding repeat containing protein [Tritrichomonas foetus]|eukprot:OHS94170.1 Pumilio-family RNA binding repeat containing protein [Tritrichomonas foetus]
MAFNTPTEQIVRSVPRSVSNGYVPPINSPNTFHRPFYPNPPNDASRRVHLISSDLWEAITGEHLTPANICQILDSSIPLTGDTPNSQSLQAMQCVLMARDRQGSRIIQKRLEERNEADRNFIFNSLFPSMNELVYDPSANFVIQKMCETMTDEQQTMMLEFFLRDCNAITDHPNGCRVLQKFIEFTNHDNVDQLFVALRANLIQLCFSQNGNHIVQRFIELLPERVQEIIDCVLPQLSNLVIDNCGCRVVQRLFEKFQIDILEPLVQEVLSCAPELATNQYGNYVVQNILDAGKRAHIAALIVAFKGHFYEFSIHKFASNVIEKCIRGATKQEQEAIFSEVIGNDDRFEKKRIMRMVGDQFGNYVIQRIIEYGTESQQNAIFDVVYYNYDALISNNYAKHVISKLENLGYEFD